ncbi:MAG: hypothetical protein Q8P20_00665 [bacterium]|nr:hypothetical protein [bacterium]
MPILIMHPTNERPGIYEDEDGYLFMVAENDGVSYLMIWCDTEEERQLGDIVFKGCWPIARCEESD